MALPRAAILLGGFAFTWLLDRAGLFRLRWARRLYFALYSAGKRVTDRAQIRLMRKAIRPGATVLDIGAAFGFYTALAARLAGPGGRVHAFEPDPQLRLFVADLQRAPGGASIELRAAAAWSEPAELTLNVCPENPGENSLYKSPVHARSAAVRGVALDSVVAGEADFIKMDIQGAECRALQGMRGLLGRSRRLVLLIECSPADLALAGASTRELLSLLREAGLRIARLDTGSEVRSEEDLADLRSARLGYCDLVCAAPEAPL